jgi:hypothetical protein
MLFLLLACTPDEASTPKDTSDSADTAPVGDPYCVDNGFAPVATWNAEGPYGELRHQIADDFSVPLTDGTTWTFSERYTGCDSYVFIPDSIGRASDDDRSIWTRDVNKLIEGSSKNVHYFFVSTQRADEDALAATDGVSAKIADALADLPTDDATWWAEHLHVVSGPAKSLNNWVESVILRGHGTGGFAVDRFQAVRGVGSTADVSRSDSGSSWPFQNSLHYFAHEARYLEMEARRQERLDAVDATLVPLWTGEVIAEYADMEAALPSAAEMAGFDTFEIDVDMRCPDPEAAEFANCGAWDYIAAFYVQEADESWTELGRFITSYHRETRWVLDATPMMAHLLDGGTRNFRWSWAPSWNTQPTETRINLRFSNQGKGFAPRAVTKVATGGSFGSAYNVGREPVDVPVSAAAKHVELWAVTTGHGAGTNSCAEFCNSEHEFTIEGTSFSQEFPEASTAEGCISQIEDQMVPNQGGTWWYGRGGWCPGQQVEPYQVDLTSLVTPGDSATVAYRGLFGGGEPPDGSGDIVLNAWFVVYE